MKEKGKLERVKKMQEHNKVKKNYEGREVESIALEERT